MARRPVAAHRVTPALLVAVRSPAPPEPSRPPHAGWNSRRGPRTAMRDRWHLSRREVRSRPHGGCRGKPRTLKPGIEQEMLPAAGGSPATGPRARAARDRARTARRRPRPRAPGDHPIHPRADLLRRLAARAPSRKISQSGAPRDLLGRQSLVLAGPTRPGRVDDGHFAEARQLAGSRARCIGLTRTSANASLASTGRIRSASRVRCRSTDVRRRVLPAQAPRGLSVPDRENVHARLLPVRRCRPPWNGSRQTRSCPHFQSVISGMSPYRQ